MSLANGLIIAFGLIALGGVGLAAFAITYRRRDNDAEQNSCDSRLAVNKIC